jgi:hypothetical protein
VHEFYERKRGDAKSQAELLKKPRTSGISHTSRG